MGNNLKRLRADKGWTHEEAASAMGISRSQLIKLERGERQMTERTISLAARAFAVSEAEVMTEGLNIVSVVGTISAGGEIESGSEQLPEAEPLYEIEVPFPVPSDAFALQVRGESMWPRYDDGDVIICYRYSQDPRPLIGWEVAAGTPEGNRYLKRLIEGPDSGRFTLESHNASPIRNVLIAWVSEIFGVVRAARWRKLDDRGKRREIRRALA